MARTPSPEPQPATGSQRPRTPILAFELDMAVPTPRQSPRQFAFDVSLLSPPLDGPTPTSRTYAHPILAPASPTDATSAPRPQTAPPAISTFVHRAGESAPNSPEQERPQSALNLHPPHASRRLSRRASDRFIAPGGELLPPPPPLFRPTTFWRNTRRSGVTGASYSPGGHLVRRSTFIAAGLPLDRPGLDLSAFGVESRAVSLVLPPDSKLVISASHE